MNANDIDTRVVEMQFDNKQFEAGVRQTIKSLENLEESLNFKNAETTFDPLIKAAEKVPAEIDEITASVINTQNSFSALQVIATTALVKLTMDAMRYGKKIANYIYDPLVTGGKRRALNIAKAKFSLEGLGIAWDDIKDDIDYGVKDTAYGLDAAAKAAAMLSASGVDLGDSMKVSLRAISGVAAQTNSSYEEIADIFSTVASNGKLMTMQLRQLSFRGLNAAKVLADAMGTTEQAVNEMVSKGQISFGQFADAMDKTFGKHAKDANQTFEGSLSNIRAALSRIGAEFASPVYTNSVKVFNSIRESINTLNKALGDTGVYRWFNLLTIKASDFASELLGSKYLVAAIYTVLYNVYRIAEIVFNSIRKVFNLDGENTAKALYEFVSLFRITQQDAFAIESILISVFTIIKELSGVVSLLLKNVVLPALPIITKTISFLLRLIRVIILILTDSQSPIANIIKLVGKFIAYGLIAILTAIKNILEHIDLKVLESVLVVIVALLKAGLAVLFVVGTVAFRLISFALNNISKIGKGIGGILAGLLGIAKLIGSGALDLLTEVTRPIHFVFKGVSKLPIISDVVDGISEVINKNDELVESNSAVEESMKKVSDAAKTVKDANDSLTVKGGGSDGLTGTLGMTPTLYNADGTKFKPMASLADNFSKSTEPDTKMTTEAEKNKNANKGVILDFFSGIADAIGLGGTILDKALTGIGKFLQYTINSVITVAGAFVKGVKDAIFGVFDWAKFDIIKGALALATGLVLLLIGTIFKVVWSISSFLSMDDDPLSDKMVAFGEMMKSLAIAFVIFALALKLFVGSDEIDEIERLSYVFTNMLMRAGNAITNVLAAMLALQIGSLTSQVITVGNPAASDPTWKILKETRNLIIGMVASMAALAATLALVGMIPDDIFNAGAIRLIKLAVGLMVLIFAVLGINKLFGGAGKKEAAGTFKGMANFGGGNNIMKGLLSIFTKSPTSATAEVKDLKYSDPLGGITSFILGFSASVIGLTIALKMLAKLDGSIFTKGLQRLGWIAGGLLALIFLVSVISRFFLSSNMSDISDDEDYKGFLDSKNNPGVILNKKRTTKSTNGGAGGINAITKFLKTFISSMMKMIVIVTILGVLPDEVFRDGAARLGIILAELAGFIGLVAVFTQLGGLIGKKDGNNLKDNTQNISKILTSITKLMMIIMAALTIMGIWGESSKMISAAVAIGIVFIALGGMFTLVGMFAKSAGQDSKKIMSQLQTVILEFALLMTVMAFMLGVLRGYDVNEMAALNTVLFSLVTFFVGMAAAISLLLVALKFTAASGDGNKIFVPLAVIMAGIVALTYGMTLVIKQLTKFDAAGLEVAAKTMNSIGSFGFKLISAMGILVAVLSIFKTSTIAAVALPLIMASLSFFILSLGTMVSALSKLNKMGLVSSIKVIDSLGNFGKKLLKAMAVLILLTSLGKTSAFASFGITLLMASLSAFVITLATLVAMLSKLDNTGIQNADGTLQSITTFSTTLLMMVIALVGITSIFQTAILSLVAVVGLIAALSLFIISIGSMMALIASMDAGQLDAAANAITKIVQTMSMFMLLASGIALVMTALGTMTAGAFPVMMASIMAGLLVFAGASMAIVIATISLLGPALTSLSIGLNNFFDAITKISGGESGNIGDLLYNIFDKIGTALKNAIVNFGSFIVIALIAMGVASVVFTALSIGIIFLTTALTALLAIWPDINNMIDDLNNRFNDFISTVESLLLTIAEVGLVLNGKSTTLTQITLKNQTVENLDLTCSAISITLALLYDYFVSTVIPELTTQNENIKDLIDVINNSLLTKLDSVIDAISTLTSTISMYAPTDSSDKVGAGSLESVGGLGAIPQLFKIDKSAVKLKLDEETSQPTNLEELQAMWASGTTPPPSTEEPDWKKGDVVWTFDDSGAFTGAEITTSTPGKTKDYDPNAGDPLHEASKYAKKKTKDYMFGDLYDAKDEILNALSSFGGGFKDLFSGFGDFDLGSIKSFFTDMIGDLGFGGFSIGSIKDIFLGKSSNYSVSELAAMKVEYQNLMEQRGRFGALSEAGELRRKELEHILYGGGEYADEDYDSIIDWLLGTGDGGSLEDLIGASFGLGSGGSGLASDISKTSGLGSGINDRSTSSINQVNSNNTFTFTQNNYSPEALSRTELYKQTRSQLQDWTGFMRAQPTF